MQLLMYLDKELIDTIRVSLRGSARFRSQFLQMDIQVLLNKHKRLIAKAGVHPAFILSGAPSSINHGQALFG